MNCNIPIHDLPKRLEGTICLYRGIPYLVSTKQDSDMITLRDMVNHISVFNITSNDRDLDVATPPLGYVQYHPLRVCYTSRKPHRKWKQGLVYESIYTDFLSGESLGFSFWSNSMRDCMMKVYPSFEKILGKMLPEKVYCEFALSNDCAITYDGNMLIKIYFRQEEVALSSRLNISKSRPVITVPNSRKDWIIHKYLSELNFEIH